MADAPWRCSQCGTVNEPVANACRTCGRWPSLFDIEESKVEELELEAEEMPMAVGVETLEPESAQPFEAEVVDVEEPDEPAAETPSARRRHMVARIIVPLGVVIYLVITLILNR